MMIVDLRDLKITGKDAEDALGRAGVTVNKNSIPFEKLSPTLTSGIRIGTPAITTRGMKVPEMEIIANLIVDVLYHHTDDTVIEKTKKSVFELCKAFPLYGNWHNEVG
jgi:glycine hydroxymethyltransferase